MPPTPPPSSYRTPTDALDSALASIDSTTNKYKQLAGATTSVSAFKDVGSALLQALDGVQNVHPLVSVAVSAFKAAYQLNKMRRDNDKKIDLVFSKMASMMGVLADMKAIVDPGAVSDDRHEQFHKRLETVAREIEDCTAVCDAYSKQTYLKKTFGAKSWDEQFTKFFDLFDRRRAELHQDLIVVDMQDAKVAMCVSRERTDLVELFRQLENPKLRDMTRFVNANGGATAFLARTSDADLRFRDLLAKFKGGDDDDDAPSNAGEKLSPEALKSEIRKSVDIEQLLREDRKGFNRKLNAVKHKLDKMKTEIIAAFQAGAHDRLSHPDIRHVWQEMGWKGSVIARHFVAALADFYQQKYSQGPSEDKDAWAACYIDLRHARPIAEAVDSDSSGWITVREANAFAASLPPGLTMTEWIAYWAAGSRVISIDYAEAIEEMRAAMGKLALCTLPSNQEAVDRYLSNHSLYIADQLVRSVIASADERAEDIGTDLFDRFRERRREEQQSLRSQLRSLDWVIDAQNSLSIITGGGQIEQFIFPLLYIVLWRHMQIIQLAAVVKLSDEELDGPRKTISVLTSRVLSRVRTLASIFRGQNLDPGTEFRSAHGGMFSIVYRGIQRDAGADQFKYDDRAQSGDSTPKFSVLRHPHYPPPADATRKIIHANCVCDRCHGTPAGPCYRCLHCEGSTIFDSIDLCVGCAQHDVKRVEDDLRHEQSHDVLRTMRVIYPRDVWRVVSDALSALKRARQAFIVPSQGIRGRTDGDNRDENRQLPPCIICRTPLRLPFWMCIECNDNKYTLCRACERLTRDANFNYPDGDSHSWHHVLVKVQKPPTDANVDDRFATVDDRLTIVEGRLATVEQKLDRIIDILTRPRHK